MIAIIYLILCFVSGYVICSYAFPSLKDITKFSYDKKQLYLSNLFVLFPAYYLIGTIAQTWCTYLMAYAFRMKSNPLTYANTIVMLVFLLFSAVGCYYLLRKETVKLSDSIKLITKKEVIFFGLVLILIYSLMWTTFYVKDNTLYVGYSVFSDFSPHLGMIRSFSYGNNFPTSYSHFAGEDIKYHFMFQFLVGNLEYLGLRIDYAFNLPSALGLLSAVSLLYIFAQKISGKMSVGFLSCFFFLFRSSYSLLTFLSEQPKGTNLFKALQENNEFIGYTTNESWGLWNLNVYCNQRHFAFSIAVLLIILLQFLPHIYEMVERIRSQLSVVRGLKKVWEFIRLSFFDSKGWKIKEPKLAIAGGFLLGAIAFWNGASTIAALLVLFALAVVADRRIEFLIMAGITLILSFLQSSMFIQGSAVSPQVQFGFIAENKTFFGTLDYIVRLTGILPYALIVAFVVLKGIRRYLMVAFSFPFLFAFTVSLTIDVTVNHKYIMISIMLLSIFVAMVIEELFAKKSILLRAICVFVVVLMTITGIYDYTTVIKKNQSCLTFPLDDVLTQWVKEHANAQDIFLTYNYSLNKLVLGGAMLYNGWQYYAWSAGYDTDYRDLEVALMYQAASSEELIQLTKENNIRYIVVDEEVRNSTAYTVNEENIESTFQTVFSYNEDGSNTVIYDTQSVIE